jgi:copper chaperone NosL
MNKMSIPSRIIVAVASLALIATYVLPVWFIFLIAPQYPEGLTMNIWLNKITGQVEIINGLNHYIGMKHISVEMFPEFTYLVYIVAFFILFGLIVAFTGSRKLLFAYLLTTVLGGFAAMYDFYKWGYDYGHNLDSKAAIQVPGLSYQPPLFGHKTLLNFDAYSYPDKGGWVIVGVGIVFFLVWLFEFRKTKKHVVNNKNVVRTATALAFVSIFITGCEVKPQPISYGKDACDECRMTIMDANFGGEIVTKKGRVYKFDDAHCMIQFLKKKNVPENAIAQNVFLDHEKEGQFLDVKTAYFVVSPALKSPMNSNAAAFANRETADKIAAETNGKVVDWNNLYQLQQ